MITGVSVSLMVLGTDDNPRWGAIVKYEPRVVYGADGRYCCEEGHWTPEAAAAHGLEVSTAVLLAHVRSLEPPAVGALALQRAAA